MSDQFWTGLFPFLTLIATAIIGYLQIKNRLSVLELEKKVKDVHESANGLTSQLIERVREEERNKAAVTEKATLLVAQAAEKAVLLVAEAAKKATEERVRGT